MPSEFKTVGRGHTHVQKDRVEFLAGQAPGGLGTAGEGASLEPGGAQEFGNELTGKGVIVYNKDLDTQLSSFLEAREPRMATGRGRKILGVYLRRVHISQPALQFFSKDLEVNWFRNAGIAPCLEKTVLLGDESMGSNSDYRDVTKLRLFAHPGSEGKSVVVAKLDIQQDSVGWVPFD